MGLIASAFPQTNPLILADSLYNNKDYFNSATEYERYLFYLPQTESSSNIIKLKLAQCYVNSPETDKAENLLEQVISERGQLSQGAQLLLAKLYINQVDYFRAKIELNDLLLFNDTKTDKSEVYKILGYIALYERETEEALNYFKLAQDSFLIAKTHMIIKSPNKNLVISQVMSSIIPGSGEIYCGKYGWGILSLIVNSASIFSAIYSYKNKQYVDASLILSLLFTRFYNGSRNNARDFAQEFNEKMYKSKIIDIDKYYNPVDVK